MSLSTHEWPASVVNYMTPEIIKTAKVVRDVSECPIIPSPVEAAHIRFEGSRSRHAVGLDGSRMSDATDLYLVNNSDAPKLWFLAQSVPTVGGFGIYFDTVLNGTKRVLIHLDNRPDRLLWLCPSRDRETQKREYVYYRADNPGPFLDLLSAEFSRL